MSHEFLGKKEMTGIEFTDEINNITGQNFSYAELRQTEITYQKDSAGYVLEVKIGETQMGERCSAEVFCCHLRIFLLF